MRATIFTILGLLGAAVLVTLLSTALDPNEPRIDTARQMTMGGDPHHGAELIRFYGCASCHRIPGVRGADALVGPSLEHMASRNYVGGVARNNSRNMIGLAEEPYTERCVKLAPGDRLYLYSGGLADAMTSSGEAFGDARLLHAVASGGCVPLRERLATLLSKIADWRAGERPHDDISILAAELTDTCEVTPHRP